MHQISGNATPKGH